MAKEYKTLSFSDTPFGRKEIAQFKKQIFLAFIFFIILMLPLMPHLLSKEGRLRFQEVNIFTNLDVIKESNRRIEVEHNSLTANILHNRRLGYALLFLKHYFDHFNFSYLFFTGDINPRFSIQEVGELYFFEIIFFIPGVFYLSSMKSRKVYFLFIWLLLALTPAATARETPHALRTLISLPTWQVIVGSGIWFWYEKMKNIKLLRYNFFLLLPILYSFGLVYFLHNYFYHYPKVYDRDWQYGQQELSLYLAKVNKKYDEVWIGNTYGRPYIFLLFYQQYPINQYRETKKEWIDSFGFYHVDEFDNYRFGKFNTSKVNKKILIADAPSEFPKNARVIKIIKFLDGEEAFKIGEL